ncbi:hypothetical protein A2U01_0020807, partial [Trifolium medium]|nr:hypothetical protein [Trifolium medium]
VYSAKGVYLMLTQMESGDLPDILYIIWHKATPLRVSLFELRVVINKIACGYEFNL